MLNWLSNNLLWHPITSEVVGCDFSGKTIVRARKEAKKKRVGNVSFTVCDITEVLPAGSFDAITSTQVLAAIGGRRDAIQLACRPSALVGQNGLIA